LSLPVPLRRVVHQCFGPALSAIIHYNTGALALTPSHIASGVVYADTRCRVVGCVWITAVRPLETGRYARSYPAAASSSGQRLRPVLFCFRRRCSNTLAGLRLLNSKAFHLLLLPLSQRPAPHDPLLWRSKTLEHTRSGAFKARNKHTSTRLAMDTAAMANLDIANYMNQIQSFKAADHARENLVNVR
jgi:hypothetical protein